MEGVKKGPMIVAGFVLVAILAGCGFLFTRAGGTALTTEKTALQAGQEVYEEVPPTPTPVPAWEEEQVSAGFVMELIEEINDTHAQDMAAVVHVSDVGMEHVAEVAEVGLAANAATAAAPWGAICGIGILGAVVLWVVLIRSKKEQ